MPDLVPVDHQPEFDHSLVPIDYDPFAAEKFANPAVQSALTSMATLPQRAIQNSQYALDTGNYDPAPVLEAATLPMGTGAIAGVPVRAGEAVLGSGAVRGVKSGVPSEIGSLEELKNHASGGDPLFVRYSDGPKFDMKPGAKSVDHQTGESHNGLSAVQLTGDMDEAQLIRSLRDYGSGGEPHVYKGKINGVDSDGAPTIQPTKYVGALSQDLKNLIGDESIPRRLDLQKMADGLRNNVAPQDLTPWQQKFLQDTEKELDQSGGRVAMHLPPFARPNSATAAYGQNFKPVDHDPFADTQ